MNTIASEAAHHGGLFFDERVPDWFERVNPATLRIESPHDCVVAQLFGDYSTGLRQLGMLWDERRFELGFSGGLDPEPLNAAWREEIARRRLQVAALAAPS